MRDWEWEDWVTACLVALGLLVTALFVYAVIVSSDDCTKQGGHEVQTGSIMSYNHVGKSIIMQTIPVYECRKDDKDE